MGLRRPVERQGDEAPSLPFSHDEMSQAKTGFKGTPKIEELECKWTGCSVGRERGGLGRPHVYSGERGPAGRCEAQWAEARSAGVGSLKPGLLPPWLSAHLGPRLCQSTGWMASADRSQVSRQELSTRTAATSPFGACSTEQPAFLMAPRPT